ncbi:hypothetical protein DNI29_04545 [Hymenobacter sediminis]|uniref:hypothetical protein n=1 Tax=Hymenobacter sediminis TaxID=2218621 RepID=UPI000DA647C5|nr:hypothetical protein [Hymenobacter sediminis]RPD50072.1 hypothetical protein DNI29_04545 [Hymenobacter sediminis]
MVALLIAARVFRALHDTMTHSPGEGRPGEWGPFWDSTTSWRLKYKDSDPANGPAFPGSTTWLVALTDGWHLTNLLAWLCMGVAVVLAAYTGATLWAIGGELAGRVVFEPVYKWARAV